MNKFGLIKGEAVIDVAAGYGHTFSLTDSGKVYVTGDNSRGQLGLGDNTSRNTFVMIPQIFFNNERVVGISACGNHSAILTQSGGVYTFGWNYYSQLGLNDTTDRNKPHKIDNKYIQNKKVKKVVCGFSSTYIHTEEGDIYSMGNNNLGELGIGKDNNESVPKMIERKSFNNEKVVDISIGFNHCIARTESGKLFIWGFNGCAQLGLGDINKTNQPTEMNMNGMFTKEEVKQFVACGRSTYIVSKEGKVFGCGYNSDGQLGLGDNTHRDKLTEIPSSSFGNEKVKEVAKGNGLHIFVTTESMNIYVFGRNGNGQLGIGETENKNKSVLLKKKEEVFGNETIEKYVICHCHSLAISQTGM